MSLEVEFYKKFARELLNPLRPTITNELHSINSKEILNLLELINNKNHSIKEYEAIMASYAKQKAEFVKKVLDELVIKEIIE